MKRPSAATRSHMQAPPQLLEGRRVLEYVVFDDSVRQMIRLLRAAPGEPAVIKAMAICENLQAGSTVELCYCDSYWNIDSVQIWCAGSNMPFVSLEAIRKHAEWQYRGTLDK